jgi:hypothetical protein
MVGLASSWATNGTAFQFTGARKIFPRAIHAFGQVQTAPGHNLHLGLKTASFPQVSRSKIHMHF